jgi:tetratricopeptide (TPR) repeat protein
LKTIYATFNAVGDIAQVPLHLLRGEVLLKSGKTEDGIQSLIKAVEAEENLRYMEPPDWKLPSRQYLGAAYFNSGNFQKAEETFKADLKKNPRNGWALQGLKNSQSKLGKKIEAEESEKLFSQVWKNADIKINAAVY